ncbi:MAG: ATP-dependent helicase, partial [Betaproteobacteria bacterium]|nr:ATP-dependent helicase [Betaproteobacteria bacterium]
DKAQWQADMDALIALRDTGSIGELIDHLKGTRRPRLSDRIIGREDDIAKLGPDPTEDEPKSLKRYRELRNVPYRELIALTEFICGFTPFATQHSVKGAEFDNVLVILSGGWNHYNWPQFFELLSTGNITEKNAGGFHRCRNLFYVAVSRPKKRLAVLATQAIGNRAMEAITTLFGAEGVVAIAM